MRGPPGSQQQGNPNMGQPHQHSMGPQGMCCPPGQGGPPGMQIPCGPSSGGPVPCSSAGPMNSMGVPTGGMMAGMPAGSPMMGGGPSGPPGSGPMMGNGRQGNMPGGPMMQASNMNMPPGLLLVFFNQVKSYSLVLTIVFF